MKVLQGVRESRRVPIGRSLNALHFFFRALASSEENTMGFLIFREIAENAVQLSGIIGTAYVTDVSFVYLRCHHQHQPDGPAHFGVLYIKFGVLFCNCSCKLIWVHVWSVFIIAGVYLQANLLMWSHTHGKLSISIALKFAFFAACISICINRSSAFVTLAKWRTNAALSKNIAIVVA